MSKKEKSTKDRSIREMDTKVKGTKAKIAKTKTEKAKKHATSIKGRLQHDITILIAVAVGAMVIAATILNCTSTVTTLERDLLTTAKVTAERVYQELQVTQAVVTELGKNNKITSTAYTTDKQKEEYIQEKVADYGMVYGGLIDTDGVDKADGVDYSGYEFFQQAVAGKAGISDPIDIMGNGTMSVIISAPVWELGKAGTTVKGVVFMVAPPDFLSEIAAAVQLSNNSTCYMLDSHGTVIGHTDASVAAARENAIAMAESKLSLKSRAKMETKMIAGEEGCGIYIQGLNVNIMTYAPISGIDGWSVALKAPLTDFLGSTMVCICVALVIAVLAFVIGRKVSKEIGNAIGTPIELCAQRLALLAQGDLHSPMPEINTKDETRILADATGSLAESLKKVIENADYVLGEISEGNFAVDADKDEYYVGEFHGLIESMRKLCSGLNKTLRNIAEAVEQVTLGATQMAETAQGLAEGATDQAGSVEELQATIINLTNIVEDSTKALSESYQLAKDYQKHAIASGEEMNDLTLAMESITNTSKQINDIIEDIEDIASQTNLLSLNAAIEAARAGEAGRGFAVVADQIRKLAEDSAQSAVRTRELIEASLQEIEKGNHITERTRESLMKVVTGMDVLADESQKAMDNSQMQAEAMEQIESGIEQISGVVQNNSATAEETSATSEELSAQATNINELVAAFKLRDEK